MIHISWLFIVTYLIVYSTSTCEAIVCYKCDSIQLAECAMSLDGSNELPYEQCGSSSLHCVMSIVDSVTYRGCSGATPTAGATYSKYCDNNLCNYQVFPPGRLKCHHCSGTDCVPAPLAKAQPCQYHNETDACYTEVLRADLVQRGCLSDRRRNGDEPDDANIRTCEINGCNDEQAVRRLKCAECDSMQDEGCKMNLFEVGRPNCSIELYGSCEVDWLLTQPESCFIYRHMERVVRGCSRTRSADLQRDFIEECQQGDYCNQRCVQQQRCLTCDSAVNPKCRNEPTTLSSSYCTSPEVSSCYACEFEDFRVQRGCGSPAVLQANASRCFECADQIDCNKKQLTRCYKCSSDLDPSCATWTLPGVLDIEDCPSPESACIAVSFANATVMRGCESESLHCEQSNVGKCQRCVGSFCNKESQLQQTRLQCHQCLNSADCDDLTRSSAKPPLPCSHDSMEPLQAPQACFEYFDSTRGQMVRGCRSNSTLYYNCLLLEGSSNCRLCQEHGCNESPAYSEPQLSCYVCERDDFACGINQQSDLNLRRCKGRIPFGSVESCFVTKHFDGSISRGCTFDEDQRESDGVWDQSTYCHESACNRYAAVASERGIKQLEESFDAAEIAGHFRGDAGSVAIGKVTIFVITISTSLAARICF